MSENRTVQLVAEVDTTQTRAGFNEIAEQASTMATSVGRSGERAQRAVSGIGNGADRSARDIESAQRNLIGSIQRTTAAMEAGSRTGSAYFEVLARQRGVDPAVLEPYLARLRQVEAAQNSVGMSARATAAAMRGVPAQITDIATSLQGGASPLTVLFQQGGQLRDMFGSASGAARALGSTLLGMITPAAVVAAAIGVTAFAYKSATDESDAYRRALITSGNVYGMTTGKLGEMAAQIKAAGGTQGDAAAALIALIEKGKVGSESLARFGSVAVQSQRLLGKAVAETASEFAALGGKPYESSVKLDEQYNYLTLSVMRQIKVLQEHGRFEEAAALAQNTYADAMETRNARIKSSMSGLEAAWSASIGGMKGAWDGFVGLFREDTLAEQIEKAKARLEKAKAARFTFVGGGDLGAQEERAAEKALQNLKDAEERQRRLAAAQTEVNRAKEAGKKWDDEGLKYLSRKEQLERDLDMARNMAKATATTGTDPAETDRLLQDRLLRIRKAYSDIYNAGIDSQIEAIKRRGAIEEEVAKRTVAAIVSAQAAGIATSLAAQIDYAERIEALDQAALEREKQRLQRELELTKGKANSEKEQSALRGQIAMIDEQSLTRKQKLKEDIYLLDVKDSRQAAAALDALGKKREAELQSLTEQLQAQRDSNSLIGKSKAEISAFNIALADETATRLENQAAIIGTSDARKKEAADMMASATQIRALAQARAIGVAKEADFEVTKKALESLDNTAHDVFTNIFNGGKNAFDRLKDTLKSGLLDMLYQMTLKRWIFNIGASVTGYTGLLGAAQGAGNVAGAGSPASGLGSIGMVSGAVSAYNMFTGAGSAITAAGNLFGSSAISAFGAGLSGGAATAEAAAAYAAAGNTAVASGLSAGASINAAIASIPGWGWAALGAAAIASYLGVFSGGGPESNTRLKFSSNNTAGNISINERGNEGKSDAYISGSTKSAFGTFGVSSTFWAPAESETVQSFIKTVGKTDDALAAFLTTAEKASVTSYLTGKDMTANVGAEGDIANSGAELSKVFAQRITNILEGIEPGLSALESSFVGTSQELASETAALLQYRAALKDSGQAVFGATVTLQQLAALGLPTESTSATLTRVTADFNATNAVLASIGKTSEQAFGAVGLASFTAREQLVLAAGGITNLSTQANFFAANFLTDAEKIAPVIETVNAQLAALGKSGLTTTQQFADAVRAIDLTTDAGRAQYVAMMQLAPAFKQVTDYAASLSGALPTIAEARTALNEAYSAERDAIKATISSTEDYVTSLIGLRSSLLVGDLSPLTPEQKYAEAKKQYEATKAAAMAGDTKAQSDLSGAITTFLTASREVNASNDQYKKDFAEAQNDLGIAISAAQQQALTAKASLTALEKQITGLTTINTSVLSVTEAIKQLAAAMGKDGAAVVDTSSSNTITSLYQSLLGRAPDSGGLQFWTTQLKNGISLTDISAAFAQSDEYKKLHGSHRSGLPYVPFDGYRAELHQGEAVLTAAQNIDYRSMGTGANAALVAAVKALQAELAQLRAESAQHNGAQIAAYVQASSMAADRIAEAAVNAAETSAWAAKTTPRVI